MHLLQGQLSYMWLGKNLTNRVKLMFTNNKVPLIINENFHLQG